MGGLLRGLFQIRRGRPWSALIILSGVLGQTTVCPYGRNRRGVRNYVGVGEGFLVSNQGEFFRQVLRITSLRRLRKKGKSVAPSMIILEAAAALAGDSFLPVPAERAPNILLAALPLTSYPRATTAASPKTCAANAPKINRLETTFTTNPPGS